MSVGPWLWPVWSISWTSRTRISSLMRGPSLGVGIGLLIGRRMTQLLCCYDLGNVGRNPPQVNANTHQILPCEQYVTLRSHQKSLTDLGRAGRYRPCGS